MNLNINGNWESKKSKLKKHFTALTDDDLKFSEGNSKDLVERIQKRLGATKNETIWIIRKA